MKKIYLLTILLIGLISSAPLPARLDDPRQIALQRQLAKADATEPELAQEAAGAPADPATVAVTHRELGSSLGLGDLRFGCHFFLR